MKAEEQSERAVAEARWGQSMAAAQAGDEKAYGELLAELLPVVRRWVRSRLFDPTAAEDVVQNALLNIHRARHTYRAERPFGPWLRAVVRNAVTDSLREGGRRREREVAVESFDDFPGAAVPASDPLAAALSPELSRALETLPEKQRRAVELIHLEGLSVAAAALRVGVTPGALKVRAHRGYRALRQRLGRRPS
jgi:RNA polymerase sigma-70 factor (ECF subfamily)